MTHNIFHIRRSLISRKARHGGRLSLLSALALAVGLTACLGPEPGDEAGWDDEERVGEAQSAVIGGTPADVATWPAVVGVGDGEQVFCTGTLIAPQAVLTAGHCTAKAGDGTADPTMVHFGTNDLASSAVKKIAVTKVDALGGGPCPCSPGDGIDIAVLTLGEAAPMAPVPLATSCGAATLGGDVTLVGYGVTDKNTINVLYSVNLKVDTLACNTDAMGCPPAGQGSAIVTTPGGMCAGDSGGPLFVVNNYGTFVAGVVSGPDQTEPSQDCSDWKKAVYPRPDSVEQWIAEKVGPSLAKPNCSASNNNGGDDGEDEASCSFGGNRAPSGPAGLALTFALLGLAFASRRRRRSS